MIRKKVANRRQRRRHAAQNGSGVLPLQSFAAFRDYSLLWRSENILSSAFSAAGIAYFIESTDDLFCLPDGSICRVIYITRNMLTSSFFFFLFLSFSLFFIISSGTRTAFPMGVAPEATAKDLCLGVGSTPYVAIFSFFLEVFISIGCATSAPDGSSPRGYEQMLVFDHRLSPFLFCHSRVFHCFKVAPEHLIKNLYLIKGSRNNQQSSAIAIIYEAV